MPVYRETATKTPAATPHDMGLSLIKVVGEVYFPSPRIRACPCPPPPPRLSGSGSVIGSGPGPRSLEAPASEGPLGRLLKKTEDLGWPAEGQRPHHTPHVPPSTYFQSPEQTWSTTWVGLPSQHSRATEKVLGERGRGRPPREDDGLSVTLQSTQHNTGGHQHSFKDLSRVELPPQTMCPSPKAQHL